MSKPLENILHAVGNTPIVRINKLSPDGINMYVKAEGFNPMGSVKDRMAVSTIEAAEASGELKPGQTVIEATSGNTGIGLAMVCAVKGYTGPLISIPSNTGKTTSAAKSGPFYLTSWVHPPSRKYSSTGSTSVVPRICLRPTKV